MSSLKYTLVSFFLFFLYPSFGQEVGTEANETSLKSTDAVERASIETSELPTEVLKGLEQSEYSKMEVVKAQIVTAHPRSILDSTKRSSENMNMHEKSMNDSTIDQSYSQVEDSRDVAQTYYQDTYDNTEPFEKGANQSRKTFYEIQVSEGAANYKLLFDDSGTIRRVMDM